MFAKVSGMGTWFPDNVRYNSEWSQDFKEKSKSKSVDRILVDINIDESLETNDIKIFKKYVKEEINDPFLGCTKRRIDNQNKSSVDVEAEAADDALKNAKVCAKDIGAIFSWAAVPERIAPSNACGVADLIGATNAWGATIDAGCASPLAQLQTACAMISSGMYDHILLTHSHLMSRAFDMSHPASPGIGDGATAMVISKSDVIGLEHFYMKTYGEYKDAVLWRREDKTDTLWWEPGSKMKLGSKDPIKTKELLIKTIDIASNTIKDLLQKNKLTVNDIDVLATLQPRWWTPKAIAENIGLDLNKAPQTFNKYAHMGGAGAIANLIEAKNLGMLTSGKRSVVYVQGAGFTVGAMSIVW